MIGWRGASRYYSEKYRRAFGLECEAIKRVREKMGLTNVVVMIPFSIEGMGRERYKEFFRDVHKQ